MNNFKKLLQKYEQKYYLDEDTHANYKRVTHVPYMNVLHSSFHNVFFEKEVSHKYGSNHAPEFYHLKFNMLAPYEFRFAGNPFDEDELKFATIQIGIRLFIDNDTLYMTDHSYEARLTSGCKNFPYFEDSTRFSLHHIYSHEEGIDLRQQFVSFIHESFNQYFLTNDTEYYQAQFLDKISKIKKKDVEWLYHTVINTANTIHNLFYIDPWMNNTDTINHISTIFDKFELTRRKILLENDLPLKISGKKQKI